VAARPSDAAGLGGRPGDGPVIPCRSRLADAVEALGLAVAALTHRLGVLAASPWPVIAALTGGRLLGPLRSG
jgi:hypothetical protein